MVIVIFLLQTALQSTVLKINSLLCTKLIYREFLAVTVNTRIIRVGLNWPNYQFLCDIVCK